MPPSATRCRRRRYPVHVHGIVNARVTALLYRYLRKLGVDAATARRDLERVWQPGGVWATFIGDAAAADLPHRYAGRDHRARCPTPTESGTAARCRMPTFARFDDHPSQHSRKETLEPQH